jgi:prepilin-type N-terminal cleavage/methylation domain-containing protein
MKLRSRQGFTLVEIMIVVAIIGILIAIAVPGFIRAREASRTRAIQADLKRIDDANQEYAIEYNLDAGEALPAITDLVALGYLRAEPIPPVGTDPYAQASSVAGPGDATTPDVYPSFPAGDTDNKRMHPQYLAAIGAL